MNWPWSRHPKWHFRLLKDCHSHWISKTGTITYFSFHSQALCQVWNIISWTADPTWLGKWHFVTENRRATSCPSNLFWEHTITLKSVVFKEWWSSKAFYSIVSCLITREAINKPPCPIFHTTCKWDYQDLRRAVFQVTSQGKNGMAGKWNNHRDNYFLLKHAQLRETASVPRALSPRQQHVKKEKQLKNTFCSKICPSEMYRISSCRDQLQIFIPAPRTILFTKESGLPGLKDIPSMWHCWRMLLIQIQVRARC